MTDQKDWSETDSRGPRVVDPFPITVALISSLDLGSLTSAIIELSAFGW